jgi:hypothetical protein
MDEPLYAVRNTSRGWLTTVNHELFLYEDRLVSVRGATLRSGTAAARKRSKESGQASIKEDWAGLSEDADRRVADVLATPEAAVLERRDSALVAVDDVAEARLARRIGICKLVLKTRDGRKLAWRWMDVKMNGKFDEVAPVVRRVFGDRLRA